MRFRSFGDPPTLSQGDTGSAVQTLQSDLIALGYSVGSTGADGNFGPNTEAALLQYQSDSGIPQTGQADAATWAALSASPLAAPTPQSNDPLSSLAQMLGLQPSSSVPTTTTGTAAPLATTTSTTTDWKLYAAIGAIGLGGVALLYGLVRPLFRRKS